MLIQKNITLKHDKDTIKKMKIKGHEYFLKNPIQEIYQNDPDIKNIIMENTATNKLSYGQAGCRFIMGVRMINYQLNKRGIATLSAKKLDEIVDSEGWKNDAWMDGYYSKGVPIENVIDFSVLVKKINKLFDTDLQYEFITLEQISVLKVMQYFIDDNPLGIKMKNLVSEKFTSHFINIDSVFITEKEQIYFRMKETYKNYNGYDSFYVECHIPGYYEIIY